MKTFVAIAAAGFVPACLAFAGGPRANWDTHCAPCHGKEGKADTTMGKLLSAKNFTDPQVQAEFTDAKAMETIKNGVKQNGKFTMTPFGNKLSEEEIKALVAYVRTLKK